MLQRTRIATARLVCAASLLFWGCTSYVQRGSALYHEGHYVEAAEVFERTEQRLGETGNRDCAEYGLYRGLTLLALGDLHGAHRWLGYAYDVERVVPGALRPEERATLDQGWAELNRKLMTGTQSPPSATNTALAAQPDAAMTGPETVPSPRPPVESFTQ